MRIVVRNLCSVGIVCFLAVAGVVGAPSGDQRLLEAIKQQDREAMRSLLEGPVDVNARQADGATALHWAAHWDDLGTADVLIRAGAEVNAANDYRVTPLSPACTNANAAMVEKLLEAGAEANPALSAGETALMTCARTGSVEAVRSLLARGADVDAKETESGQTALMWAAAQRHPDVVQLLIERGADVHARSKGGFTPMLFAARVGDTDSARILLAAGVDVNDGLPVTQGATTDAPAGSLNPLLMASASGQEEFAIFLLNNGADPNAWDGGSAAIHYALLRGFANAIPRANYVAFLFRPNMGELVKALLAHGADPNVRFVRGKLRNGFGNAAGATPFLLATSTMDTELMRLLVANGADPLLATNANVTPLMLVAGINRGNSRPEDTLNGFQDAMEAVRLAIELGNDIHAVDIRGRTALHGAAYTGSEPIVQFLVDRGADVNGKTKDGETPWSLAMSLNNDGEIVHEATANLLLELGATRLTAADFPPK